jgi:hypothetical protein
VTPRSQFFRAGVGISGFNGRGDVLALERYERPARGSFRWAGWTPEKNPSMPRGESYLVAENDEVIPPDAEASGGPCLRGRTMRGGPWGGRLGARAGPVAAPAVPPGGNRPEIAPDRDTDTASAARSD